jgi:hypothetical protein
MARALFLFGRGSTARPLGSLYRTTPTEHTNAEPGPRALVALPVGWAFGLRLRRGSRVAVASRDLAHPQRHRDRRDHRLVVKHTDIDTPPCRGAIIDIRQGFGVAAIGRAALDVADLDGVAREAAAAASHLARAETAAGASPQATTAKRRSVPCST